MALSSINFQKVSVHSFKHNDRTEAKTASTVFAEFSYKNIVDVTAATAKQNLDLFFKESISKVTGRERRADKKNTLVEAVVNIKPNTTLEDLKELQKHIEKEFGFTGLQIAIHKDEGHYENGKFITNDHAHLSFFTLDKENGRQMFRREHITRDKLRVLQTETAKILNMDRGKSKEETGRERLNHKDWKQAKKMEAEKVKDLDKKIEELRQELIASKNASKEDYNELKEEKRRLKELLKNKDLTIDNLNEHIEKLKDKLLKKDLTIDELQDIIYQTSKEKDHLKSIIKVKEIDNIDLEKEKKELIRQKEQLQKEINALKTQNKALKTIEIDLREEIIDLREKINSRQIMGDSEDIEENHADKIQRYLESVKNQDLER